MRFKKQGLIAAVALAASGASTPASALSIVLRTDNSFTSAPNGAAALFAFQKAANYWNQTITTNATLTFDVHFNALRAGVLGSTLSNTVDTSVASVYRQLAATGNSALDASTVASLRPLSAAGGLAYRTPGVDANGNLTTTLAGSVLDNNDTYNNRVMNANTSVDKGLGIGFNSDNSLFGFLNDNGYSYRRDADADITFSSTFAFDFDPTNGIGVGQYDFVAVAIHEMGHALGFVSGADDYDYYSGPNGPGAGSFTAKDAETFSWLSTLDLFRFGANAVNANGTHDIQLDPNREAYFSIDGGRTPFTFGGTEQTSSYYSTGRYGGDGQQASHWKDTLSLVLPNGCVISDRQVGIMDPTIGSCSVGSVTANDIAAFDAMGWNVNFDVLANKTYAFSTAQAFRLQGLAVAVGVPEAATWMQMIFGFGLIGGVLRNRKSRTRVTYA